MTKDVWLRGFYQYYLQYMNTRKNVKMASVRSFCLHRLQCVKMCTEE